MGNIIIQCPLSIPVLGIITAISWSSSYTYVAPKTTETETTGYGLIQFEDLRCRPIPRDGHWLLETSDGFIYSSTIMQNLWQSEIVWD